MYLMAYINTYSGRETFKLLNIKRGNPLNDVFEGYMSSPAQKFAEDNLTGGSNTQEL